MKKKREISAKSAFQNPVGMLIILLFLVSLYSTSCEQPNEEPADELSGKISFSFEHRIDGEEIDFDQLIYTNQAGNQYLVNEIQYFISDVTLHQANQIITLDTWNDILYIDTDISSSLSYLFKDEVPVGQYEKITFTFGINESKNQSLMFVNPPESLMFWPEILGGGYHYMKLNGKWLDTLNNISPFNFHLGIGQIYHSFPDSISSFVQNYFIVDLPDSSFEIRKGETAEINLIMNVENWFNSPKVYNHDVWGGDIMQKQDAMKLVSENGWDVFTLEK